jgi:hypothetical protein
MGDGRFARVFGGDFSTAVADVARDFYWDGSTGAAFLGGRLSMAASLWSHHCLSIGRYIRI